MSQHANATFAVKQWDESPWPATEGKQKLTHSKVINTYRGDLEGEGVSQSLMVYFEDGSARFIGMERFEGRLGERTGSFVTESSGDYDQATQTAKSTSRIIPGSGTGELKGLRGEGGFVASHGESQNVPVTLDYEFEA